MATPRPRFTQPKAIKNLFGFPHPVNEFASRVVASMVAILTSIILVLDLPSLMLILVYGFLARVLTGPSVSPMGLLATRVVVPLLGNPYRATPGPPKRFAQLIGLLVSTTACICHFGFSSPIIAKYILGILLGFATLEAIAGICGGCIAFGYLMRWGIVPQEICIKCSNITTSRDPATTTSN